MNKGGDIEGGRAVRKTVSLLVVLLGVFLVGADSSRDFDGAMQLDEIQGTWAEVSVKLNGKQVPKPTGMLVTFDGARVTYQSNQKIYNAGTYRTDNKHQPFRLDERLSVGLNQGSTYRNIYRIDGDRLRIAYVDDGSTYPESFETAPFVDMYVRVKK
jgi:uncharacterized protein (TIGR03067 family)